MTKTGVLAPGSVTSSDGAGVALVGGGPGDPDLVTRRAEALLAAARTVVIDAGIAHLAGGFGATVVTVPDRTPAVDALLAAERPVVRLYTGDTWLHPAHDTEAAALTAAGIAHDAIAGVATELAVPALAGIAVHVRHLAVACTIADADHAPAATDPSRTLVLLTHDGSVLVTGAVAG